MEQKLENIIATEILKQAFKIHTKLGPGLLESVYENCLQYEMIKAGYKTLSQVSFPIKYDETLLEKAYKIDLLVEDKVLVEVKSVEILAPVHFAQTLTYCKLREIKLGILINFNTVHLKDGIPRIANKL